MAAIRQQNPSLEELIHHHQVTGNFQDALACYSSLGREQKDSLELKSGMLRCYLEMVCSNWFKNSQKNVEAFFQDQPSTASMLVKGLENNQDLIKYQIEAAWNLSQWQLVEESCAKTTCKDWSSNLGKNSKTQ